MWSLPDIKRMNSDAASQKAKIQKAFKTGKMDGKKIQCAHAEYGDAKKCSGEIRLEPWYDIFSDDPKGIIAQCDYHDSREGTPEEYFYCDGCYRTIIRNYTWENYYHITDSEMLCLPCWASQVLADENEWIELTHENINKLTFDRVSKSKHLIAVEMPVPEGIRFVNNTEFDSMSGDCISGGGVEEIKATLRDLMDQGDSRAILILDAAYQFAVSIGVYAEKKGA